jgi:tRNA guanosine-2'-O-methyltransferase
MDPSKRLVYSHGLYLIHTASVIMFAESCLQAFNKILAWGDLRPSIVAQMASNYYNFWSKLTDDSLASLQQYKSEFTQLLIYGPMRDREDQKMDGVLLLKATPSQDIAEADG